MPKEEEKLFHSRLTFCSHNESTSSYSPVTPTWVITLSSQFKVIYSPCECNIRQFIEAKLSGRRNLSRSPAYCERTSEASRRLLLATSVKHGQQKHFKLKPRGGQLLGFEDKKKAPNLEKIKIQQLEEIFIQTKHNFPVVEIIATALKHCQRLLANPSGTDLKLLLFYSQPCKYLMSNEW